MAPNEPTQPGHVSDELDELSCGLLGDALDLLAEEGELPVIATVEEDGSDPLACTFDEDSTEMCLDAARAWVHAGANGELKQPARYAIAYLGAVSEDGAEFTDCVFLEFGEAGAGTAYSAYTLVHHVGQGEDFTWSEPAPAGEMDLLI